MNRSLQKALKISLVAILVIVAGFAVLGVGLQYFAFQKLKSSCIDRLTQETAEANDAIPLVYVWVDPSQSEQLLSRFTDSIANINGVALESDNDLQQITEMGTYYVAITLRNESGQSNNYIKSQIRTLADQQGIQINSFYSPEESSLNNLELSVSEFRNIRFRPVFDTKLTFGLANLMFLHYFDADTNEEFDTGSCFILAAIFDPRFANTNGL